VQNNHRPYKSPVAQHILKVDRLRPRLPIPACLEKRRIPTTFGTHSDQSAANSAFVTGKNDMHNLTDPCESASPLAWLHQGGVGITESYSRELPLPREPPEAMSGSRTSVLQSSMAREVSPSRISESGY
jgi:hypothetical protein